MIFMQLILTLTKLNGAGDVIKVGSVFNYEKKITR